MKKGILTICLCVLLVTPSFALADWKLGDPYKMHFPQLPDPCGWDVMATTILDPTGGYLQHKVLADDWRCTETGRVEDVHFWGSWKGDEVGEITNIHLSIHADIPKDPCAGIYYSRPGEELWSLDTTDFTVMEPFYGEQGWFNPNTEEMIRYDHNKFFQYNIENIQNPFTQEIGKIYWLDISVTVAQVADGNQPEWGWKTADVDKYPDQSAGSHFMDDAVWCDCGEGPWSPLCDPCPPYESLDLAFVITPEPATIALLGLGSLVLLRKRRA